MKQYHDLLKQTLEEGNPTIPAREGLPGTLSFFGAQHKYNLRDGFPLLTTKKTSFNNILVELLWFLRGNNNIRFMVDNNCNIWNEDAYNYYCLYHEEVNQGLTTPPQRLSFEDFMEEVKKPRYEKLYAYDYGNTGFQYPTLWRSFPSTSILNRSIPALGSKITGGVDQISNIIDSLRDAPFSRRHIVNSWSPATLHLMALPSCHAFFQFYCRIGDRGLIYLDCQLYQRSADVFLGVPYNIASYALLVMIIAKIVGYEPGVFVHTLGDVGLYTNHIQQAKELLSRDPDKYPLPKVEIMDMVNWADADLKEDPNFFAQVKPEHFTLSGYDSYPAIKAPLNTGIKNLK